MDPGSMGPLETAAGILSAAGHANVAADVLKERDEMQRLRAEVEELKVRSIVERNPGIDPDEVRQYRKEHRLDG